MLPTLWILAGIFGLFVLLSEGRKISEPTPVLLGDRSINAGHKLHRLASVAFSVLFFITFSGAPVLPLLVFCVALCGLGINAANKWRVLQRGKLSADRRLAFRETLSASEIHFLNILRGV